MKKQPSEPKEKLRPMTNGEKEVAKGLDEYFDKEKSEPKDWRDRFRFEFSPSVGCYGDIELFIEKELATAKQQGYEEGFTIGSEWKKNRTEELEKARSEARKELIEEIKKIIQLCEAMYGRGGCGAIYDTIYEHLAKLKE